MTDPNPLKQAAEEAKARKLAEVETLTRKRWSAFFFGLAVNREYSRMVQDSIVVHPDGSVTVMGELHLGADWMTQIPPFPSRLVEVKGKLNLACLRSIEGITLPVHVGGALDLTNLRSADGLVLPLHIGGYLSLASLRSASGLAFPEHIFDDLNLYSLTSTDGLILPTEVDGNLNLHELPSAVGLVLPQRIGGVVYLNKVSPSDRAALRASRPDLKIEPNP
jgi:hypothetical protein